MLESFALSLFARLTIIFELSAQAVKHPSKPVGYYQPKYTQIDR